MECYICRESSRRANRILGTCEINECRNTVGQYLRYCSACSKEHNICERCGVNLTAAEIKRKKSKLRAFEEGRKYSAFLRLSIKEGIKRYLEEGNTEMKEYCESQLKEMEKRSELRLLEYKHIKKELEKENEELRLE